jgi:hypothetical protein
MAERFTKNYDLIANYFPIFNNLKGIVIGIAFAKFLQQKKIPINK